MDQMSSPSVSRRTFGHTILLCGASVALPGALLTWTGPAWAAGWEKIGEEDGIKVYRKDMPGTSLHAFRGTAVIHAPMEKLMWLLGDNDHRTDWVDRLKKSVVLERENDYDYIIYQHFGSPPIVSDRDFVYRARAYSKKNGNAVLEIESVKHPKAPATVGVRGELKFSSYELKPLGKNKTFVDVSIAMDPKGALPKWVVNLVQKSWPYNTLTAMRKEVKKPFVGRLEAPPVR